MSLLQVKLQLREQQLYEIRYASSIIKDFLTLNENIVT